MVLPAKRKERALSSEEEIMVISESSDPLEGISSDESDYAKPTKNKKKQKAKPNGRNARIRITEDQLYTHRPFCEKCSRGPADDISFRSRNRKKRKTKKDADVLTDDELAETLGGWLECEKCVVSSHWGCIAAPIQKEIITELRQREGSPPPGQRLRRSIAIDESASFVCAKCSLDPACFVCHQDHSNASTAHPGHDPNELQDDDISKEPKKDVKMDVDDVPPVLESETGQKAPITIEEEDQDAIPKFRCIRCKQGVHYQHLTVPRSLGEDPTLPEIAYHYKNRTSEGEAWLCHQCREWIWTVDIVIAWRPSPANAVEPELDVDEKAHWKDPLAREYLVKWTGRGFRHATWVPHPWIQMLSPQKLRNFLEKGPNLDLITDETLAAKGDEMAQPTIANLTAADNQASGRKGHGAEHGTDKKEWNWLGPGPDVDAEKSLPIEWSTIDRVLDIMLLPPRMSAPSGKKRGKRVLSPSPSVSVSIKGSPSPEEAEQNAISPADQMRADHGLRDGQEPPGNMQVEIEEWERLSKRSLEEEDVEEVAGLVTWCFVKWDDLQYDQSTWDTPPPTDSSLYPAFKHALKRYLRARRVDIPVLTARQCRLRDEGAEQAYVPPAQQPDCIVGGTLMPFQMEGFQWLLYKHFRRESCILADDMGLGKTIQIASVLGYLGSNQYKIYPCLVVVPNSTITNWVREFEKWVPHMRVVPYYGEAASRKVISRYELYHKGQQGLAEGLKAHVVLTTYDMITGHEFNRVFGKIPRWEVLCIDEGQRLKSDDSLIFRKLRTLNSVHRILLTGTPLNNNLRELFNLLNFLDPSTFKELEDLEKRFENLNETLITELHEMIKPYILRRIKADVLKLPPKIEIIVPISLTPLQKQVYKGIFEKNSDLIQAILRARKKKLKNAN
ncbi:uncharacterized protein I303_105323 [Kwoniella dejecticola CBS 10117]|uniref:Helicase ATP-binding domain-containing protein n=1 Tax=Kwoniella dejecticola CBS 10117 TaxID=1296121 RepID=A0A1A6A2T6_9TREE|nr:uncharacterized protein I303_05230 [Kwoniella dejecticola CBS 10117]OBR84372.1 hypothetical protein I303_05230 [Kwoniella dejecticola CBS 10117]